MSIDEGMGVQTRTSGAVVEQLMQHALAESQAKVLLAKKFPRDETIALDRILQACTRQGLAEVAVYAYPRGDGMVTGPSIRLAEEVARHWGNLDMGVRELSQQDGESEVEAFAWDLERNIRKSMVFRVRHWRSTKKGGYALTDPRDIFELVANQGSRRLRSCILATIPGDVMEAALHQCEVTQADNVGAPAEQLEKLVAAFAEYGVTTEHLVKRLKHKLEATTGGEVVNLKRVYASIRDGMGKPADYFDFEQAAPDGEGPASAKVDRATALAASVKAAREKAGGTTKPAEHAPETAVPAAQDHAGDAQTKPEVSKPVQTKKTAPAADSGVPAGVDPATGEVGGVVESSPAPTFAQVMARVETATGEEDLDLCLDLTNAIANLDHRTEVRLRIGERRKEFAAK